MSTLEISFPEVAGLDVEDAKQALRATAKAIRSRQKLQRDVAAQWRDTVLDFIGDGATVACYVSMKNEPPTHELCEAIAARGKRLLLPKLGPRLAREWAWFEGLEDLKVLAPGRPPEPSGSAVDARILREVDVLIMPATLVDHHGRRLGQGGGWYDRVLKQLDARTRVGAMIYPDEFVDVDVPQDDMDRRVPYVIFPDRWVKVEDLT